MEKNIIQVELFTIPQAACNAEKANWSQVGEMVKNQLKNRFGNSIGFNHIEFMSEKWFNHKTAQRILENGEANFPFVLVDDEMACADKKINISKVNRAIQSKLQQ